jgi:hypothetical protein
MGMKILDHENAQFAHGHIRLSTDVRIHYYIAGMG